MTNKVKLDDILDQVGGFGLYQVTLTWFVYGARLVTSWSMTLMSFAGMSPDWWCIPSSTSGSLLQNTSMRNNHTYELCPRGNSTCTVVYSDDMYTVVNEWDLICDLGTIPETITAIQMAGVLVGALIGGQSSDIIGRKKVHFLALTMHGICNIIAAFSFSWQMFATLRFFIGFSLGVYIAVSYIYVVESYGVKWRSILASIPMWMFGTGLFAMAAWLKPDWFYQHIFIGSLHVVFLLGWFILPDSLRWLTVQGRVEEAEKVVEQMSRYNRKVKPDNTTQILKQVAEEEEERRRTGKTYTYIEVYRPWSTCWRSIVMQFIWACLSLVFYGISFGAGSLSGSLYLNIFLLSIVEVPGSLTLPFFANRLGRRWATFMFLFLASICAFGVTVVSEYEQGSQRGVMINVFALICKLGIGTGWGAFIMLTAETYPTVIRNLGVGAANTISRIGGIMAPFVFGMKKGEVFVPFLIVGSLMATCSVLVLLLRETKGRPLQDTLTTRNDNSEKTMQNGVTEVSTNMKKQEIATISYKEMSSQL